MTKHFLSLFIITATILGVSALLLPVAPAHAQFSITFGGGGNGYTSSGGYSSDLTGMAQLLLGLINTVLVPMLFAIAFIVFLWGMFRYFIAGASDPDAQKKGKQLIFYGLIGFVVMISLWGLVNVLSNTFGLAGFVRPAFPTL